MRGDRAAGGGGSSRSLYSGFEQTLKSANARYAETKISKGQDKISLGTISSQNPTVSHLMVDHPEYHGDCWEIIHSRQNYDKSYTSIPSGIEIFMDPDTKELSWEGQNSGRSFGYNSTEALPDNYMEEIEESITGAASRYNLPGKLISGVIHAESGFDVSAVSHAGARGLMQLMPETARQLGVENPFDIRENIDAGARYLRKMLDLFDGSLEKALAAYNAGPAAVKRFAGDVPYTETRNYVARVLSFLNAGR